MMPLGHPLPSTVQILKGEWPAISAPLAVEFVPGSKWQYSGAGYTVLQLVLERYYRQSFAALMKERVLGKLHMLNSSFTYPVPRALMPYIAHGHDENGKAMNFSWYNIAEPAAGGLWSTPTDLARFVIEIQQSYRGQGKILKSNAIQQMLAPYKENFGLGLRVGEEGTSKKWFGHAGDNLGYKAVIIGFIENGDGAVIMTNSDDGWGLIIELLTKIGEVYGWPIPAPTSF